MSDTFPTVHKQSLTLIVWATVLLLPPTVALWLTPTNQELFFWLNDKLVDWFGSSFWALWTNMGDGFFLFPLAMLLVRNDPEKQLVLILTIIFAALALNISKSVIDATRPLGVLGNDLVTVIGPEVKSKAMPSGHSGTVFLLAGLALAFTHRVHALMILAFASVSGLARVAVGAHWPADVIAGAWVGLLCTAAGVMVARYLDPTLFTRIFYIFLGYIPVVVLPFYDNGFQDFAAVQIAQYMLALLSLTLSVIETRALVKDFSAQRGENA